MVERARDDVAAVRQIANAEDERAVLSPLSAAAAVVVLEPFRHRAHRVMRGRAQHGNLVARGYKLTDERIPAPLRGASFGHEVVSE